jgi:hypothetical protein
MLAFACFPYLGQFLDRGLRHELIEHLRDVLRHLARLVLDLLLEVEQLQLRAQHLREQRVRRHQRSSGRHAAAAGGRGHQSLARALGRRERRL